MSGNDCEHHCNICGDTWIAHAIDNQCFRCEQIKCFDEIDEFINNHNYLDSISCSAIELRKELKKKKKYYLLDYIPTKDLGDCTELFTHDKYDFDEVEKLFYSLDSPTLCNSKWLWSVSNDFRPYERWLKSLDKVLKSYCDVSPLKIEEIKIYNNLLERDEIIYKFDFDTLNLLMMPLRGRMFNYFRIYRSQVLCEIDKNFNRNILNEFFQIINEENRLKEQAEKEWNDI